MDNVTYTDSNQRKIEKFVLTIYSIYGVSIMYVLAREKEGGWINFVLLFGLMLSWIVYFSKVGTYSFRAKFTAIMMQVCVFLYAIHMDKFTEVLPVFSAFVVFLGLYGLPKVINITVISIIFIFVYHCVISGDLAGCSFDEIARIVMQLGNMLLLEYVMFLWTKRNNEGSSKLLGAIEELKTAERSKNDFLANVSHEIRTPINSICGMSEIILREELDQNVKESVQDIQMAGRNLMSVVGDILDFSELQSGKIDLEEEAYNITSTINDVINMTMARKSGKKIELIVDCDAHLPCALLGDEKKLRRVIMNLVDNAIKFTEEGCVTILIGYRKEAYGINLTVTIKDTGIGMDEESLEKLFTSFSQVDASRRRHEGGVGLGLAISNALVRKMGGAIMIKSKLGKGTSVKIVVPQKILDETPIISIGSKENINAAIFIDMEQFDMMTIRDEYSRNIIHMVEQIKGKSHICRNFAELQRRAEKEKFSHVFISVVEYRTEQVYYDKLAEQTLVVVVLDRVDEMYVTNPRLLKIYKPFYILTVAAVLNETPDERQEKVDKSEKKTIQFGKFVTKGAHVLAVDDNATNLRVIQGLLSYYKIRVTTAISGKEALEKITSADYDFVFMDHMMPEMDGVETLHRIRNKVGNYYQKVPIVALTANAAAGTREMMLEEGFTDFLEKPVERSVLERVLKRNLPAEKIISLEEYNASVEEERESVAEEADDAFKIEGLDVSKGILYCNGKEQYLKVLRGYCEDCNDMGAQANRQYEEMDWKNYTITVHGMKSAMHTIGALELSAVAKELEFAGKEGRIDYILEHHGALMEEYQKLFWRLRSNKLLFPDGESEQKMQQQGAEQPESEQTELPVLKDDDFERMIEEMEEAMYDLDASKLLDIMSELQKYQYHRTPTREFMESAKRKVEMSDYISAVEMVTRWKNKVAGEEK